MTTVLIDDPISSDVQDGGAYRIVGTAKRLGVLIQRRVRLFDRETGRLLRETLTSSPA